VISGENCRRSSECIKDGGGPAQWAFDLPRRDLRGISGWQEMGGKGRLMRWRLLFPSLRCKDRVEEQTESR
jgi:hypothetical protein